VNYADTIVRMGLYSSAKAYVGWPITPGFEVAGVVGDGVDDLAVGDEVFAVTRFGGYASHVVVARELVFPITPGLWMALADEIAGNRIDDAATLIALGAR
jgi:NADPH:quinone reductase-like Zn-dependent oxidoreductase